jgi:hypothetical protein
MYNLLHYSKSIYLQPRGCVFHFQMRLELYKLPIKIALYVRTEETTQKLMNRIS